MSVASSDKASENCRAATASLRASHGSNSFERINQSQKHEWEQLQLLIGLLFYSTLKLYLVTSRIVDPVPSKFLDFSHWLIHILNKRL